MRKFSIAVAAFVLFPSLRGNLRPTHAVRLSPVTFEEQTLSPISLFSSGARTYSTGSRLYPSSLLRDENDRIIPISGGRQVGIRIMGNRRAEGSKTVLYFPGNGGSRLEPELYELGPLLEDHLIISFDFPGIGLSSFQSDHGLENWPQIVLAVAQHLDLKEFRLFGYSQGAPYALACAAFNALAPRILLVDLVSPLGPLDDPDVFNKYPDRLRNLHRLAMIHDKNWFLRNLAGEWVRWWWIHAIFDDRRWPSAFEKEVVAPEAEVDQRILRPLAARIRQNFMEVFSQDSPDGWLRHMVSPTKRWPFSLNEIRAPIRLYHGTIDRNVPFAFAVELVDWLRRNGIIVDFHTRYMMGHRFIVKDFADILLAPASTVPRHSLPAAA